MAYGALVFFLTLVSVLLCKLLLERLASACIHYALSKASSSVTSAMLSIKTPWRFAIKVENLHMAPIRDSSQASPRASVGHARVEIHCLRAMSRAIVHAISRQGVAARPLPALALDATDLHLWIELPSADHAVPPQSMADALRERRRVLARIETALRGSERFGTSTRLFSVLFSGVRMCLSHINVHMHTSRQCKQPAEFVGLLEKVQFAPCNAKSTLGQSHNEQEQLNVDVPFQFLNSTFAVHGLKLKLHSSMEQAETVLHRFSSNANVVVGITNNGDLSAYFSINAGAFQFTATTGFIQAVLCARADLLEHSRYVSFRKRRPARSPVEEPDSWWRHAVDCVMSELERHSNASTNPVKRIASRRRREEYIAAYNRVNALGLLAFRSRTRLRRLERELSSPEQAVYRWQALHKRRCGLFTMLRSKETLAMESSRRMATFHAAQRVARGLSAGPPNFPALTSAQVQMPLILISMPTADGSNEDVAFAVRSVHLMASQKRESTGRRSFFYRPSNSRKDTCKFSIGALELSRRPLASIADRALDVQGLTLAKVGGSATHDEDAAVTCAISASPDETTGACIRGWLAPLRIVLCPTDARAIMSVTSFFVHELTAIQPSLSSTLADEVLRAMLQGRESEQVRRLLAPSSEAAPAPILSLQGEELSLTLVLSEGEKVPCGKESMNDWQRASGHVCAVIRLLSCSFKSTIEQRSYEAAAQAECFFALPVGEAMSPALKPLPLVQRTKLNATVCNCLSATPDMQAVRRDINIKIAAPKLQMRITPDAAQHGMLLFALVSPLLQSEDPFATGAMRGAEKNSPPIEASPTAPDQRPVINALNINFNVKQFCAEAVHSPQSGRDTDGAMLILNSLCVQASITYLQNFIRFALGSIELKCKGRSGKPFSLLQPVRFYLAPETSSRSAKSMLRCWRRGCLEAMPQSRVGSTSQRKGGLQDEEDALQHIQQIVGRVVSSEGGTDVLLFCSFLVVKAEASIMTELANVSAALQNAIQNALEHMKRRSAPSADEGKGMERKELRIDANLRLANVALSVDGMTFAHFTVSDTSLKLSPEALHGNIEEVQLKDALWNAADYEYVVHKDDNERNMIELSATFQEKSETEFEVDLQGVEMIFIARLFKDLIDYAKLLQSAVGAMGTRQEEAKCDSWSTESSSETGICTHGPRLTICLVESQVQLPRHSWASELLVLTLSRIIVTSPEQVTWSQEEEIYVSSKSGEHLGAVAQVSNLSIEQVTSNAERGMSQSRATVIQPISSPVTLLSSQGVYYISTRISWLSGTFGERQLTQVYGILGENIGEKSTFGPQPIRSPNLPIGAIQPGTQRRPKQPASKCLRHPSFVLYLRIVDFFAFADGTDPRTGSDRKAKGPKLASLSMSWCNIHVHSGDNGAKAVWIRANEVEIEDRRFESAPNINVLKCPHTSQSSQTLKKNREKVPYELIFYKGGEDHEGRKGPRMLEINLVGADLSWPYLNDLDFINRLEDAFTHCIHVDFVDPHPHEAGIPEHWTSIVVNMESSQLVIPAIAPGLSARQFARTSGERRQVIRVNLDDFSLSFHKGGAIIKSIAVEIHDVSIVATQTSRKKTPLRAPITEPLAASASLDITDSHASRYADLQANVAHIVVNMSSRGCSILKSCFQRLYECPYDKIEHEAKEASESSAAKEVTLSAFIEAFEAKVIDDRQNDFLEVLNAQVSHQTISVRGSTGPGGHLIALSAVLDNVFQVEHLNSAIENMQPVIRPIQMRAEMQQAQGRQKFEVIMEETLSAVLSPTLMSTIGDLRSLAEALKEEGKRRKPKQRSKRKKLATEFALDDADDQQNRAASYVISNRTGLVVACTSSGGTKPLAFVKAHADKRLSLNELEEERVTLPDSSAVTAVVMSLQFEGDWMPITDVIVNHVGRYLYHLHSPFENLSVPLHIDVSLDGRVKTITLHSPLRIRNTTSRSIMGSLYMRGESLSAARVSKAGRTHQTDWIQPGGELYFPVFATQAGLLYLKAFEFEYSDKDVIDLDAEKLYNQQGICACPSTDGETSSFNMSVSVNMRELQSTGRRKRVKEFTIVLKSHFVLKNSLPSTVSFSIRDKDKGSSSEMSISGGDEVDIAGVNPYHRLMLHINTFGGLASYDGLLVHQPRSSAPSKLLERSHGEDEETDLLSEFGGHLSRQELILRKRDSEAQMEKLRISVANEYESESKQRHVTLYTPFWFINDSFLQLMLKSKGSLVPKFTSRSSEPMPMSLHHKLELSLPTTKGSWSRPISVSAVGVKSNISIIVPKELQVACRWKNQEYDSLAHVTLSNSILQHELEETEFAGLSVRGCENTSNEAQRQRGEAAQPNAQIELGLDVRMGSGTFSQTKLITATPRYIIVNKCGFTVECKQTDVHNMCVHTLRNNEHIPFHWADCSKPFLLTIRPDSAEYDGSPWLFPMGIRLERSGYFGLRLKPSGLGGEPLVIPVHSSIFHSSYIIKLCSPSEDDPPYRLENRLPDIKANFIQKGIDQNWETLLPGSSLNYFWDDVERAHRLKLELCGHVQEIKLNVLQKTKFDIDLIKAPASAFVHGDKVDVFARRNVSTTKDTTSPRRAIGQTGYTEKLTVVMTVTADGPTRVLTIATDSGEGNDDDETAEQLKRRLDELEDQLTPVNKGLRDATTAIGVDLSLYGISNLAGRQSLDTIESGSEQSGPSSQDSILVDDELFTSANSHSPSGPKSTSKADTAQPKSRGASHKHAASVDIGASVSEVGLSNANVEEVHGASHRHAASTDLSRSFEESGSPVSSARRVQHSRSRSTAAPPRELVGTKLEEDEHKEEEEEDNGQNRGHKLSHNVQSLSNQYENNRDIPGGNLSVTIGGCSGLSKRTDSYVKVLVGDDAQTTSLRRGTSDPEWNEELYFHRVSSQQEMLVTVYGKTFFSSRDFLGQVFVNLNAVKRTTDDPPRQMPTYTLSRQHASSRVHGTLRMEIVWHVTELELMRMKIQAKEQELSMKEELLAACQMQQSSLSDDSDHDDVTSHSSSQGEEQSDSASEDLSSTREGAARTLDSNVSNLLKTTSNESSLQHNETGIADAGNLSLKIVEARNLLIAPDSLAAVQDVQMYAVVRCGNAAFKHTAPVRASAAPQWNESLNIRAASLERTIFITIYAKRRFGSDWCIGTARFSIKDFQDGKPHYCALKILSGDVAENSRHKRRKKAKRKSKDTSQNHPDGEDTQEIIGRLCVRIRWEALTQQFNALDDFKSLLKVKLHAVGVTLVDEGEDSRRREVAHFQVGSVDAEARRKQSQSLMHMSIGSIQLDNQILSSSLPVVVARTPRLLAEIEEEKAMNDVHGEESNDDEDEDKLEVKPQLEFALKLQDHGSNVTYIKHCDLLLQDLDVELEEDFVNNIVAFINTLPLEEVQRRGASSWKRYNEPGGSAKPVQEMLASRAGTRQVHDSSLYLEYFRIQPMRLYVTVKVNSQSDTADKNNAAMTIYRWTRAAGFPILNLQRASMQLKACEVTDSFLSKQDFAMKLKYEYLSQAIWQLCKVGGGIEVLQPAASFVYGVGSGVRSFFYEPARGAVEAPDQLGKRVSGALGGVMRGTSELFTKSFRGAFDTLSNIADTASRGLAYVSMDQSYAYSLHSSRLRSNESNAQDFFIEGVRDLWQGVFQGVSGVFLDPFREAGKRGFFGFFRGCLGGLIGLAAKPSAGVLQFTSKYIAGIKTLSMGEQQLAPKRRIKPPERLQQSNASVSSADDVAWWQRWLQNAAKGRFASEDVMEVIQNKRNRVAIFTRNMLLYCIIANKSVKWAVHYTRIVEIYGSERFLQVALKERKQLAICGKKGSASGIPYSQRRAVSCVTRDSYDSMLSLLYEAQQLIWHSDRDEEEPYDSLPSAGVQNALPEHKPSRTRDNNTQELHDSSDATERFQQQPISLNTDVENLLRSVLSLCFIADRMQTAGKAHLMLRQALECMHQLRLTNPSVGNATADSELQKLWSELVTAHDSEPQACARRAAGYAEEVQKALCMLTSDQPVL